MIRSEHNCNCCFTRTSITQNGYTVSGFIDLTAHLAVLCDAVRDKLVHLKLIKRFKRIVLFKNRIKNKIEKKKIIYVSN